MDIKGFQFSAVEAAIKKPGRRDLALIFSEVPAQACAVFTVSTVKAAPFSRWNAISPCSVSARKSGVSPHKIRTVPLKPANRSRAQTTA